MRPFEGIYEKIKFPPYRFAEFPKDITAPDGSRVTVRSRAEEIAVALRPKPEGGEAKESIENERDRLAMQLAETQKELAALRAQNSLAAVGQLKPVVGEVKTEKAPPAAKPKA